MCVCILWEVLTSACNFLIAATYRCCARYGQGSGVIHLDYVGCGGTEASLLECSYRNPSSSDSHREDVGVICPTCTFLFLYNVIV